MKRNPRCAPAAAAGDAGAEGSAAFATRRQELQAGKRLLHEDLQARMLADLAEIEHTRMPFGRYGPAHHPPHGVPIYDLPAEYLQYFATRGFPKGRLGVLLQMVYQMKADGADGVFDEMRRRAGGRVLLRKIRSRVNRTF